MTHPDRATPLESPHRLPFVRAHRYGVRRSCETATVALAFIGAASLVACGSKGGDVSGSPSQSSNGAASGAGASAGSGDSVGLGGSPGVAGVGGANIDGGVSTPDSDAPSSADLPLSRLIGGATLDPNSFWPPTGQDCATTLDASGTVPTQPPQAFTDECSACHGANGTGHSIYPNIAVPRAFADLQTIVRGGRVTANDEMPFFKPEWLNDDDLRRIWAFLTQSRLVETKNCQPLPAMSDADIQDASSRGIATWRLPDGKTDPAGIKSNVACVQCHAPDPLDLAYYGFKDSDVLRRGLGHLPGTKVADIVDMIHALRAKYDIGRRNPMQVRPFQPGGGMLPGSGIVERDAAFGQELASMKLIVATKPIASAADAEAALAEVWAIDRHSLRIPVPFNRYSEDGYHNPDGYVSDCTSDIDGCDDHGSIADWIPVAPHIQDSPADFYAKADAYIANPTDDTEGDVRYDAGQGTMPGTYDYGTHDLDDNKYRSLVLANYCVRLEVEGKPGCYDKGVVPFPNKADMWNIGSEANLFGTNYEKYPACDTTWQSCGDAPANLPQWPAHLLANLTPGATLSSNFSRLRHPWMTLWWTHFDPTLLATGDPTAQKDEYFTRSIFWSNDNDEIFDGSKPGSAHPTYGIFAAYEVLMHNVATLENPNMASCKLWPATDFPCTAVDVRSGYYPDVINFAEQNQPGNAESSNNVHYQTLFMPTDPARRATYQLLVANLYRLFFWKLIGSLQEDNWMCDQDVQKLRMTRAQEFLTAAETQASSAAQDKTMFDTLTSLMAQSTASCPPLATN
jgi:mono/diheme cytochrome c family protein